MNTERKLFKYKRVAIDFDGTLVESVGLTGYNTDDYFGNDWHIPAMPGAAEATWWLKQQGFEILIFTCRPDYQRKYMEHVLERNGIYHDYILFYTKPLVDLYIDDKGFRFTDWNSTQNWIKQNLNNTLFVEPTASKRPIGMEPQNDFEDLLRKERVRILLKPEEGRTLDVGCGSGKLWQLVGNVPNELYGVEPDSNLRQLARQTNLFKFVYHGPTGVQPSHYDLVTIFGVLEHVDSPEELLNRYSGANEIAMTVPNANSFHRNIGKQLGMMDSLTELCPQDLEVGHKRVFTYDSFHELISNFCHKNEYKIRQFGTLGFKFTDGNEMMQFADRWDAINEVAQDKGLIGSYARNGAELYARLEKI